MNMTEQGKQDYRLRVSKVCPQTNLLTGCAKAFIVGGAILHIGAAFNGTLHGSRTGSASCRILGQRNANFYECSDDRPGLV